METDVEEFRYTRMGYIDRGRKSDQLLASFLSLLPGDGRLPLRWHYRSHARFQRVHGTLGRVLWAAAGSSHLLMVNGFHALRIWHDTAASCYVDIATNVLGATDAQIQAIAEVIPAANARKCKPFTQRVKVTYLWQMQDLVKAVKKTYGLHTT